jgi:pimeloyl-ACP methyl ester carboxylesterase
MLGPVGFLYCRDAHVAPDTFIDTYTGPDRHDTPALLARIDVPTVVVIAGGDAVVRGLGERSRPVPGRVDVMTIDGADHQFRDLYGEDLADAMAAFLAQ